MSGFEVKDSGERMEFESGMVRDVTEGKTRFDLCLDGPMFGRWAEHLTKGAEKYEARNWMKAAGEAERDRFRQSAVRHFVQWYLGHTDEDHAAAVFFNINGAEYVGDGSHSPSNMDIPSPNGRSLRQQLDAGVSLEEALRERDWFDGPEA